MDREQREVFEQYFRWQAGRAGAVTPGQMLDLVRELRRRAQEQGEFPLGPQTRGKLPPNDPMVKAVLAGEDVSVGGRRVVQKSTRPGGLRAAIALAAFLIPVAIAMFLLMARGRGRAQAAPTPTPLSLPPGLVAASPTAPAAVGAAATATSLPLFTAGTPTATTVPTTTASGYAVVLGLEEAAAGANDPASLEIAGNTFALGMGKPQAGVWQPTGGAEWLAGTELRRVIAVPATDALAAAVARLRAGDEVRLRLRSGEVVRYQVGDVVRVKRHQIEVLAGRNPSLAVVLYGERTGERTVVIAEAVQEEAFAVYTPVPGPLPTPATTATQIITTATVVTNEVAGLVLEVSPCNRVARVGDQQPPKTSQQFMVCPVRLRALRDGAQYSGQSLAVTEKDWFLGAVGWWPPTVALPTAIGEGALMAGEEVSGQVAGIVTKSALARRSEPVLVWEQSGIQYIIILE